MPEPFDGELARLKERIRQVEAMAAESTHRAGLETALADAMGPTRTPVDPARRRLESVARGFVPDPQSEAAIAARAKDRRGYDRETRRVGGGLELALYERGRDAAIKLGTFVPDTTEGDAS